MTNKTCRFMVALLVLPLSLFAQAIDLIPGKQEQSEIEPGKSQIYQIDLQQKDLAFIRFDQQGADISIEVIDPNGQSVETFDGINGGHGPELVHILPDVTGRYSLQIKSLDYQKKPGNYSVTIDQIIQKAASPEGQLDQLISYWALQGYLPGFATAIVTKDQVLYQKAYGFASLEKQKPYTLESIQNIGSVSKTLIGLSLMKAVEDGMLSLKSNINDFLPYEVVNPYHPEHPITIKHLATHTSSIAEGSLIKNTYLLQEPFLYQKGEISKQEYRRMNRYSTNKAQSMGDFLQAVLAKEGKWYKKKNFLKQAPGEKHHYSNVGAALAAYIIEIIYKMPYHEFTKQFILGPLEMNYSGWTFDAINKDKHTDLHFLNKKVLPKYRLITYPEGGLLTNIIDLSKYLQSQMQGYYGKDQVIGAASFQTMMSAQLSDEQTHSSKSNYAIFWEIRGDQIGHNGGDPGTVCLIRFNSETGIGRLFMTNIMPIGDMANKQFTTIWNWLDRFGELIQKDKQGL